MPRGPRLRPTRRRPRRPELLADGEEDLARRHRDGDPVVACHEQ